MRLARALLVAAVGTLATGAAAQPALKSDFFRDDPTAIAIAAGAITRNINDVGLVAGVAQGDAATDAVWGGGLKSDFFRDDPPAIAIAAGAITRNINDVGLVAGVSQGDSTTFAYPGASAYRQGRDSYP